MPARYEQAAAEFDAATRRFKVAFTLVNDSREFWRAPAVQMVPYRKAPLPPVLIPGPMAPGSKQRVEVEAEAPAAGKYRYDVFPVQDRQRRLILEASFDDDGSARLNLVQATVAEYGRLAVYRFVGRIRRIRSIPGIFLQFVTGLWAARSLTWSLARRDLAARYRGSMGDTVWAGLDPVVLMVLYLFIFGVVLRARFPGDPSTQGFALYFLAGMLPWLAISDPIARAPNLLPEHRNYVKKVVFPLEILNVSHALSAVVAQGVALVVLLGIIVAVKGSFPLTLFWFPLLLVPQLLMTLGVSWFFSALGVFLRDLGQVIGFLLTAVFFLTPICYPETALPHQWLWLFRKNPVYILVRGWRAILIEERAPGLTVVVGAVLSGFVLFALGSVVYARLRRSFADVL